MLQLKNVELSCAKERWFRSPTWTPILRNINLNVQSGELVALVGGSGEGKSLLLQNILGLLPTSMRSSGQILIDDQIINTGQQRHLRGIPLAIFRKVLVRLIRC
ncbi:Energy-coupling factor transporter ATP-binding protein EcfA 1 [Budvicia aquatica]|uniref:Energy-coupling factor transporter ATP-binding protein EcfA 1 n=1 Tax=Budvicia aquatica TaxID=82979 RepID=A0A484ZED0_9GAMM|nr:Energy-coupling factor transporter ATP-binding protein EcfA 1 [Budvicia aquatica]